MADEEPLDVVIKIVLAGPDGVGKSRLVARLARDDWQELAPYESTLGIDFAIRSVYMKDSRLNVRCRFWDTSGQTRFHAVTMSYYHNADIVLLCFDASQPASLDLCLDKYRLQKWLDTANRGAYVALVACKSDQRRHDADEAMMKTMEDAGLPVHWTSSRAGTGITELLQEAGEHVLRTRRKEIQEQRFVDSAYLVPKPVQQRTTCECLIL